MPARKPKLPELKPAPTSLALLAPKAMVVNIDGNQIVVPLDKFEAAIMASTLVHHARHFVSSQITKYMESDAVVAPKELKDLSETIRNINAAIKEVSADIGEPITPNQPERPAEKTDDSLDFEKLTKKEDGDERDTPEVEPVRPEPTVPGKDSGQS